ncbi:peptidoglycan-binding protein [Sulfitobacter sp. D35]|uniref:peptidoglycan-binding protein n=1 Tax=Sulfitobacter sp. D35 TaxID=3083252 RepID=UPI00296FD9DA|nr:peptidoglycan-binding protein [Sulfitobacter sp. D35]MDW4496424.1 peptidoglycan-binding protein [Sulfitobacter sp. D35]
MNKARIRRRLRRLKRRLDKPFEIARAANDAAEMERLEDIAEEINDLRENLDQLSLGNVAASVKEIRAQIDGGPGDLVEEVNLGGVSLAALRRIIEQSLDDAPVPDDDEDDADRPKKKRAAEDAQETPSETFGPEIPPPASPALVAAAPVDDTQGRLVLTEAHLIALWKRSQFPIKGDCLTVFGLRGCRPVMVSGTGMASGHEITMAPVNYETMNCTMGHWHPGKGLAVFPGSTVPFGVTVARRLASGGVGVNQMGRGRYDKYTAGWHKRSEGSGGHWALQQDCAITIQRTANDTLFDNSDRWEVGRIAGDNIHCAFHMGVDGNVADARFSSAGCQTIAGTVKKGRRGSEQGPFRNFITPFADRLGGQKSCEYVLFAAEEAQIMIRTHYAGKSVILRMGSQGPLVAQLQEALNDTRNSAIKVDGDFGPNTFQAVIDFQTRAFGPDADDGIVGAGTAAALDMRLPDFDFEDAISGGQGHGGPIGRVPAPSASAAIAGAGALPLLQARSSTQPDTKLAFGAVTRKKHGQAFNEKVIAIANRLRCDPNHLMAVMAFETGESFSPAQKNAAGSGATGLIQFMPATARDLGTSTSLLAKMSAIAQLDIVERYLKRNSRGHPLVSLPDVYMTVLLPAAVGKLDSHVLFSKPSRAYEQNKGLDKNRNGRITKAEAAGKVQDKLVLGMKAGRFG